MASRGFRVKVDGITALVGKLKRMSVGDRTAVERELDIAGELIKTTIQKSLGQGPWKPGKNNRSGEGGPPKTDEGTLEGSINADREGLVATVGTSNSYAARLEFGFQGTDSKGRKIDQGERPFIHPAFVKLKPTITKRIRAAIIAEHKKVSKG